MIKQKGKKKIQKAFYFSSEETKRLIETYLSLEADIRGVSTSRIIEEFILGGIARNFPETKEEVKKIYKERYGKYLDSFLLE